MKTTMVIPSYWRRASNQATEDSDAIYDHPTSLDENGTLGRALESLNTLKDKEFELIIIAAATADEISEKVEEKVAGIISSTPGNVAVHLFSHSHLKQIHDLLRETGNEGFIELLQIRGYSNIRNLCLFLPHLFGSDIAILIDDDEVFEDSDYMGKAREFIGRTVDGEYIGAVAGYYLQPDGDWRIKTVKESWTKYWDKLDRMNDAFERIIGTRPRLKETPFVFGGNMVVHRDVFTRIPFDPSIRRGEDIDFLINMKMFGYKFFLDNTLSIKHLPPPKTHPIWKRLREDILRFVREREKLRGQEQMEGMVTVTAEELAPYPGLFLMNDLEEKIVGACTNLADYYRSEGKETDAQEAMNNIELGSEESHPGVNAFNRFLRIQELWEELMEISARTEIRQRMKGILTSQ